MSEWIPADKELPGNMRCVLATDIEAHFVAIYEDGAWVKAGTSEPIDSHITHWNCRRCRMNNRWTFNPNRYLWSNHGTWWMRVQPYDPAKTERVALNLKTRDIEEARRKRDEAIANNGWRLAR